MTIMVDEIRVWTSRRPFHRGSCHLTTDGTLDELHAFAAAIGMKREWFQPHPLASHYDLTPKRRAKAIELGAVEVSAKDQARARIARRKLHGGTHHEAVTEVPKQPERGTAEDGPARAKLYLHAWEDRRDARDLLLWVFGLYLEACANEEEWSAGIDFALDEGERRRHKRAELGRESRRSPFAPDEQIVLMFARAELAKWQVRRVLADRLLATAQTIFEHVHQPALSSVEEDDIRATLRAKYGERAA